MPLDGRDVVVLADGVAGADGTEGTEAPTPTTAAPAPQKKLSRLTLLVLLSVFVHVPLYGGFRYFAGQAPPFEAHGAQGDVVHLRPFLPKPTEPPIPPDAQFVDTPAQEHIPDAPPVETKLLSNKTTRTDKETRSNVSAAAKLPHGATSHDAPKPTTPSVTQSPSSKSPDPTTTPKPSDKVELAGGGPSLPVGPRGTVPKSVMEQGGTSGTGKGLLLPSTSASSALANLQALDTGDLTSTDHLPGVDRGRQTVLNANQYRFADFFMRVKAQVEKHWRPSEAYLRRDPTGQAYGVKDRYTVLRVELDRGGNIAALTTTKQSGLDFMDEEAKRAFRAAHPFLNPPLELFDPDGRVRFEFGFYFEITAGKYRFNWKRL